MIFATCIVLLISMNTVRISFERGFIDYIATVMNSDYNCWRCAISSMRSMATGAFAQQ